MIRISYDRDGHRHTLVMTGHAGYARGGGPDIVCAAASALTCTLLQRMVDLRAEKALAWLGYEQKSGDVWLTARPHREARERVREAFDTVLTGLAMLAEKYPEHVRLSIDAQNGGTT